MSILNTEILKKQQKPMPSPNNSLEPEADDQKTNLAIDYA